MNLVWYVYEYLCGWYIRGACKIAMPFCYKTRHCRVSFAVIFKCPTRDTSVSYVTSINMALLAQNGLPIKNTFKVREKQLSLSVSVLLWHYSWSDVLIGGFAHTFWLDVLVIRFDSRFWSEVLKGVSKPLESLEETDI